MRKFLLASVATLGTTGGLAGVALAQAPAPEMKPGAPTQGQMAYPAAPAPTAYVNNNNNYQAPMLPGALANPTPGTIVVHVNGKVQVDFQGVWTSADQRAFTAPAAGSTAAILGNNGTGTAKLQPQSIDSFARIYLGGDGMATNGLRYGAAIEVRENFTGQPSGASASTYSSMETLFVRRAFTYVAGDNWGIFRFGQADGLISIFDNGVTTFQFLPTGNLGGGDLQTMPGNVAPPLLALAQQGAEYANSKAVYLSPQIAGFDFGVQYAPNTSNGFGLSNTFGSLGGSITGSGTGTGINCGTATTGCPSLSSGPGALDGSRVINEYAVGLRYQGLFNGVGVLAYGVYEGSGHADYSGLPVTTAAGAANLGVSAALAAAGSKYTGNYQNLSIGSGGLAVTYAGFTVGGNIIGGDMNGQVGLTPQGGANLFNWMAGGKYVMGPWTIGLVYEQGTEQGTVQLAGISQRRIRGFSTGLSYTVAPGYIVYGEYLWNDQYQGANNFITGATLSGSNNNIKGQGFLIGNVVNF